MPSLGHPDLWQWPDQSVLVETSNLQTDQSKVLQVQMWAPGTWRSSSWRPTGSNWRVQNSNLRESRFSSILENFFPISLLDLDLEAFLFHFSLSISISRHFHFTFHSRNEWKGKKFHFSFLEKSESISDFTFFLEKKKWIMHVLSWKIQKIWSCITQKCNNSLMVILFSKSILVNEKPRTIPKIPCDILIQK